MIIFCMIIIEIGVKIIQFNENDSETTINEVFLEYDRQKVDEILSSKSVTYSYDEILLNEPNQIFPTLNVNSHGFRGPEITLEKPENTYRIFMIGGSTMFGASSTSDKTTIPGYIQQFLDETDSTKKFEVINAGINNADSRSEVYLVKKILLEFEPDLLIAYDGWNDARHDWGWDETIEEQSELANIKNSLEISLNGFYMKNIKPYYSTIDFVQNLLSEKDNLKNEEIILDYEFMNKKAEIWTERWIDICELGEQKGFKTIIILQPGLGTGNKPLTDVEEKRLNEFYNYQRKTLETLEIFSHSLNNIEENCENAADLRNAFDGVEEPIFIDLGHMSDKGNRIIAENIFPEIIDTVLE